MPSPPVLPALTAATWCVGPFGGYDSHQGTSQRGSRQAEPFVRGGRKEGVMTEEEWLECAEPELMLPFLGIIKLRGQGSLFSWGGKLQRKHYSERKLRLFACVCCCRVMRFNREEVCQNVIDTC